MSMPGFGIGLGVGLGRDASVCCGMRSLTFACDGLPGLAVADVE